MKVSLSKRARSNQLVEEESAGEVTRNISSEALQPEELIENVEEKIRSHLKISLKSALKQ
ncbi:MAG: hypothetical protein R2827_00390 [Bdellovibrionales bacterium]